MVPRRVIQQYISYDTIKTSIQVYTSYRIVCRTDSVVVSPLATTLENASIIYMKSTERALLCAGGYLLLSSWSAIHPCRFKQMPQHTKDATAVPPVVDQETYQTHGQTYHI